MKPEFNLSAHRLSRAFWETVLERCHERLPERRARLLENYARCERFRARAGHDTGSVSVASGVCLYALCAYFQPSRVAEVGTFIGKSTTSMALAIAEGGPGGAVFTCDRDNDCFQPWDGVGCEIRCFPGRSSTEMLSALAAEEEEIDLFFFDGRIQSADLPLIKRLSHPGTLHAFDDFEGIAKGVVNAALLRPHLEDAFVIEPCPPDVLERYGVPGRSLVALLYRIPNLRITDQ
ncbi:MAG: hypothetical protein IT529_04720 [Burkholderiales bacterium]|nr:hypothetical protein [Burkholderiales bacterium]